MLFSFLFDIADFLRDLLEGVFVSGILDLEVWAEVEKSDTCPANMCSVQTTHLAASWELPLVTP